MFSGIVEEIGIIHECRKEKNNVILDIKASFSNELHIDESVSHNGVCLTVIKKNKSTYRVVVVEETLSKTNLGSLKKGDPVNLERSLKVSDRINGHFVQGHVDCVAKLIRIKELNGSHLLSFKLKKNQQYHLIGRGSIAINGTSLTLANIHKNEFDIAIIPYTYSNTIFKHMKEGDYANIEFDMLGKYIFSYLKNNVLK
ncbi:MAG TPA: riboflavin synthase [Saprospiraceae bacterium]|nr:riboflavin synthase [Saprospiraceae bacterium]